MIRTIKIALTIILIAVLAFCVWFIIDEIKNHKNWTRIDIALLGIIAGILDFLILWFA